MQHSIKRLLLVFLFSCVAAMANTCAATVTGNWSNPSIWATCGGTYPHATDTVSVPANVTLTCDIAVCTSSTMSTTSPGTFIISTGSTWTPTGNATLGTSAEKYYLTFQGGSGLNCSPAASTNLTITIGYAYQYPSVFTVNGTAGSHVTLTTTPASGATCSFVQGQVSGLSLDWHYGDFSYFSNASNKMLPAIGLGGGGASDVFTLLHNTFFACGSISQGGDTVAAASVQDIEFNNWSSSTDAYTLLTYYSGTPTGLRVYANNVSDKMAQFHYPNGWTLKNSVFLDRIQMYQDTDYLSPTVWANNFHQQISGNGTGAFGLSGSGTEGPNYWYVNSTGPQDSHFIQCGAGTPSITFSGDVFEAGQSSLAGNEGSVVTGCDDTVTVTGAVITPDASGTHTSGRVFAFLGGASTRAISTSNTYYSNQSSSGKSGITTGEGSSPYSWAGMIVSVRYNNVWGGGWIANDIAAVPVSNTMASTVTDYNNGFGLATGTCNNGSPFSCYGYGGYLFSAGTPGVHDRAVNSAMVDPTRNLKKWDAMLGGPGTEAHALAGLSAMNTSGWDARYNPADLIAWVRQGYTPTNLALYKALNGKTPGAIEMSPQLWNDVR
jgi:hypothetical protein